MELLLVPDFWITLATLTFLEIILGVDNIVFITITTNRLPESKQSLGRKLGLAGAFCTRVIFLCFASFLASMQEPLFTIAIGSFTHSVSIHDLIMLAGGVYLIFKGSSDLYKLLKPSEDEDADGDGIPDENPTISLPRAIGTIMVMDVVFSIDSVITAVGLAEYLIVMVLAVMIAITLMIIFIDKISGFINRYVQMTILALVFITVIGALLVCEGLQISSGIELLGMGAEKLVVYFAMLFCFVVVLLLILYEKNHSKE